MTLATGYVIGLPALVAVSAIASNLASHGAHLHDAIPAIRPLVRTLAACLLIATIAWGIALSIAWPARRSQHPARAGILLLLPLMLPPYLAYSGWGLLRAPGTTLGDWLMLGPGPGLPNPWPMWAGYILAVLGLALAIFPLPTLIFWLGFRAVDQQFGSLHEGLLLEPISRVARLWHTLAATRGTALAALALPALVMLGSAVPLHLAQLDTLAIDLWRRLDLLPAADHWRLWLAAWPVLTIAIASGWWLSRTLEAPLGGLGAITPGRAKLPRIAWCWIMIAAVLPVALHARSLSGPAALLDFWRVHHAAMLSSAVVALVVGLLAAILSFITWIAWLPHPGQPASRFKASLLRAALTLWIAAGLIPGILIGLAMLHAWQALESILPRRALDQPAFALIPLVLAHLARFGFIPVLIGLWLARTTPRDLIDLAALEGHDSPRSLTRTLLQPRLIGALVAGGFAGLLSLHEIEASVILQPPGTDNLARVMLQNLHYLRDDALAAGVITIAGTIGITLVFLACIIPRLGSRQR
jgi:ABC-type Fe3+ transport system permease subunit